LKIIPSSVGTTEIKRLNAALQPSLDVGIGEEFDELSLDEELPFGFLATEKRAFTGQAIKIDKETDME
jgi:hypothetical protein